MANNSGVAFSLLFSIYIVVVYSLFIVAPFVWRNFVFGPSTVVQYFLSFLALQSYRWGRESWLSDFYCLLDVCSSSVIVLCFFLKVPWVGLRCMNMVFTGHS